MKKTFFAITITLLSVTFISTSYSINRPTPTPFYTADTIRIDTLTRSFNYYAPANVGTHPALLFAIHGSGATGEEMQFTTGRIFDKLADAHGNIIIVYPSGYHKFWNDCRKAATYEAKTKHIDDVAFFKQMIRYFVKKYNADTTHVFATGMSNGGQMCLKLAMEAPELFKGIAPVAASMPLNTNNDCHCKKEPVSILFMNGTADPINPYNGGEVIAGDGNQRGKVYSTEESVKYWLKMDGCDPGVRDTFVYPDVNKQDNSTAINYTYQSKKTGKKVVLIKVVNGGHIYPNPGFLFWPKLLGNINRDISAPEIIYDFFEGLK